MQNSERAHSSVMPRIENINEMYDIHCTIMVFMVEGHITLAGAMNTFEYTALAAFNQAHNGSTGFPRKSQ